MTVKSFLFRMITFAFCFEIACGLKTPYVTCQYNSGLVLFGMRLRIFAWKVGRNVGFWNVGRKTVLIL